MANSDEAKKKNLVYLMIKRYPDGWKDRFPSDMGIPLDKCIEIYDEYCDEVMKEIENDDETGDSMPTVEELISKAMKKLRSIINSCDDPSKLTRSIEILQSLPKDGSIKREERRTIYDKLQEKLKNEK